MPYDEHMLNKINIFNEAATLMITYMILPLQDKFYSPDELYEMGFSVVYLLYLIAAVNFFSVLLVAVLDSIIRCKRAFAHGRCASFFSKIKAKKQKAAKAKGGKRGAKKKVASQGSTEQAEDLLSVNNRRHRAKMMIELPRAVNDKDLTKYDNLEVDSDILISIDRAKEESRVKLAQ